LGGDFRAQPINDFKPAIPASEPPAHAGFVFAAVPIAEDVRVTLTEEIIEFVSHS
jgi:hypothetical protein